MMFPHSSFAPLLGLIACGCGPVVQTESLVPPAPATAHESQVASTPSSELQRAQMDEPKSDAGWFEAGAGDLAAVEVEKRLFERSGDKNFYLRFRVQNRAAHEIGIDVRDGDLAPYPNQWGGLGQPERLVIDEIRLDLSTRRGAIASKAVAGLHAGALQRLAPGAWLEFYRPFNAGGVADVKVLDKATTPYLFVSCDGAVAAAASTVAEVVETGASLILKLPVAWGVVPADARVIPH